MLREISHITVFLIHIHLKISHPLCQMKHRKINIHQSLPKFHLPAPPHVHSSRCRELTSPFSNNHFPNKPWLTIKPYPPPWLVNLCFVTHPKIRACSRVPKNQKKGIPNFPKNQKKGLQRKEFNLQEPIRLTTKVVTREHDDQIQTNKKCKITFISTLKITVNTRDLTAQRKQIIKFAFGYGKQIRNRKTRKSGRPDNHTTREYKIL